MLKVFWNIHGLIPIKLSHATHNYLFLEFSFFFLTFKDVNQLKSFLFYSQSTGLIQ